MLLEVDVESVVAAELQLALGVAVLVTELTAELVDDAERYGVPAT